MPLIAKNGVISNANTAYLLPLVLVMHGHRLIILYAIALCATSLASEPSATGHTHTKNDHNNAEHNAENNAENMGDRRDKRHLHHLHHLQKATFGGGCFWCLQPVFDDIDGVVLTAVGFMGGHTKYPTYQDVSTGRTGHVEVVQVTYDASIISYHDLLGIYWRNVDATASSGSSPAVNSHYRSVIFTHSQQQFDTALANKTARGSLITSTP